MSPVFGLTGGLAEATIVGIKGREVRSLYEPVVATVASPEVGV